MEILALVAEGNFLLQGEGGDLTFARFHHKRQARVDAVSGLLGLLYRCHRCVSRCLIDLEGVVSLRRCCGFRVSLKLQNLCVDALLR